MTSEPEGKFSGAKKPTQDKIEKAARDCKNRKRLNNDRYNIHQRLLERLSLGPALISNTSCIFIVLSPTLTASGRLIPYCLLCALSSVS